MNLFSKIALTSIMLTTIGSSIAANLSYELDVAKSTIGGKAIDQGNAKKLNFRIFNEEKSDRVYLVINDGNNTPLVARAYIGEGRVFDDYNDCGCDVTNVPVKISADKKEMTFKFDVNEGDTFSSFRFANLAKGHDVVYNEDMGEDETEWTEIKFFTDILSEHKIDVNRYQSKMNIVFKLNNQIPFLEIPVVSYDKTPLNIRPKSRILNLGSNDPIGKIPVEKDTTKPVNNLVLIESDRDQPGSWFKVKYTDPNGKVTTGWVSGKKLRLANF